MNPAANLVLVGPTGAGKSSLGKRIAARLGLVFVDVDREIETRTGTTISTIFDCEGEAGFRGRERQVLHDVLAGHGQVVATGAGAVLDAGNRACMRERGFVVHLHVSLDQQLSRLAPDRSRPLLANGDRAAVLATMAAQRLPFYREVADLDFDTDTLEAADAAIRLARLLDTHWTRAPGDPAPVHGDTP